jgi:hypothetical protein
VEKLGAGSRPERVYPLAEPAFELIETHPGEGIRWGLHLDRRPAVIGGWSAWGGVRVVSEVNRELKHAMPVTARGRLEATNRSPEGGVRVHRDEPRVDDSPRWVERQKSADDRGICLARVHREDAAATVRGMGCNEDQRHACRRGRGFGRVRSRGFGRVRGGVARG